MKNPVIDALQNLAASPPGRKKIGLLRDALNEIEALKRHGLTDAAIVESLQTHGIDISIATFKSALYRLRKERKRDVEKRSKPLQDPILAADRPTIAITTLSEPSSKAVHPQEGQSPTTSKIVDKETREATANRFFPDLDINKLLIKGSQK